MTAEPRRELRTGRRRALRAEASSYERIVLVAGIALLAIALLVVVTRRDRAPAAIPREAHVVTVPVPLPVERPVEPPGPLPVEPPAPRRSPVRSTPTPPRAASLARAAPAATAPLAPPPVPPGAPSASELAALYRSVGQTLEQLDRPRADALWPRYRWIRLADYLATADRRAEAARMLAAIASDARAASTP